MHVYSNRCLSGLNPFWALKTVLKTGKKKTQKPLIFKGFRVVANPTEVDTIWGKQLNIAGVKAAYLILMTSLLRIVIPLFR